MKDVGVSADTTTEPKLEQEKKKIDKESIPLSPKCQQEIVTSPVTKTACKSGNETFNPAIWPSFADLLEDTPHVEDDELNDNGKDEQMEENKVFVDRGELEKVLTQAVSITRGCSVMALMDLYGQLNRVVVKNSRMTDRNSLPQELNREIIRFQEIQKRPQVSSRCETPAS